MSSSLRRGVPFHRAGAVGHELAYLRQAIASGRLAGNGPFTHRCQEWLSAAAEGKRVMLLHSATAGLELAMLALGVGPGDEVVMPSFTFVATANAVALRGATVRFVDIREDTLNLDERLVEAALSPRTRAIVPVHYAGVGCEMAPLLDLAHRAGIRVVEDAAQALGSSYRGRPLGAFGDLGVFSFHETKNLTCGEGGALVVGDPGLVDRLEILWEKGTDRARFFRGEVDKYTWQDLGSTFYPGELSAAFLLAQLERSEVVTGTRMHLWERYREGLADLAEEGTIRLPTIPESCRHNAHIFHLRVADLETRTRLLAHLKAAGIGATFHFVPLHDSPMGRRLGGEGVRLPITEAAADRLVRLPLYPTLGSRDQARVIREVRGFFGRGRRRARRSA